MRKMKYLLIICCLGILIVACAQTYVVRNGVEQSCKHRQFKTLWCSSLETVGIFPFYNPLLLDSGALVWSFGVIVAFDIESGKTLWKIDMPDERFINLLPLTDKSLLTSTKSGKLYIIDMESGKYRVIPTNIHGLEVVCCETDGHTAILKGYDDENRHLLTSYDLKKKKESWRIVLEKGTRISFDSVVAGNYIGIDINNKKEGDILEIVDGRDGVIKYSVKPKYDNYSFHKIDNDRILIFSIGKIEGKKVGLRQIINLKDGNLEEKSGPSGSLDNAAVVIGRNMYNINYNRVVARDLYSGKRIWETSGIDIGPGCFYWSELTGAKSFIVAEINGLLIICDINSGKILYRDWVAFAGYATNGDDLLITDFHNRRIELLTRCSKKE